MVDRGTTPSSLMISGPRWNSFRRRLSRHLSPLAPGGPLYPVVTGPTPQPVTQRVYFAAMALLDHRASPSRRSWLETALIPAGGWKFPLS